MVRSRIQIVIWIRLSTLPGSSTAWRPYYKLPEAGQTSFGGGWSLSAPLYGVHVDRTVVFCFTSRRIFAAAAAAAAFIPRRCRPYNVHIVHSEFCFRF